MARSIEIQYSLARRQLDFLSKGQGAIVTGDGDRTRLDQIFGVVVKLHRITASSKVIYRICGEEARVSFWQGCLLHLDIPVGLTGREIEVMVIYQPVQAATLVVEPLENLYSICAGDPIHVDEAGVSDALDEDLAGAFE